MVRLNSKVVAELMGKRHDNLMRTIRTDCEKLENPDKYYRESKYQDGKGQERDCYEISLEGCKWLSRKLKQGKERVDFLEACKEQATEESPTEEKVFTAKEVAEKAGVSERQVRRWLKAGKLPAEKQSFTQTIVSERYVVTEAALREFLKERRAG